MPMTRNELRSSVQRAYSILFAYILAMVEEVGTDRALDILSQVVENRGREDGKILAKKLGISGGEIEAGFTLYKALLDQWGVTHEIVERTDERILIRVGRCPIYDALHSADIHCDWMMEGICDKIALPLATAAIRHVSPDLKVVVRRFRTSSEADCLEELCFR
jgi:hypothetical protein